MRKFLVAIALLSIFAGCNKTQKTVSNAPTENFDVEFMKKYEKQIIGDLVPQESEKVKIGLRTDRTKSIVEEGSGDTVTVASFQISFAKSTAVESVEMSRVWSRYLVLVRKKGSQETSLVYTSDLAPGISK